MEGLKPLYWQVRKWALHQAYIVLRPDRVRMPGGRTMHLHPGDARSAALWGCAGNLNKDSMALWQALLRLHPWSVVLDVGSNHGEMLLYPDLPPSARVVAFEPNPDLAPLLRRSLADSGVPVEVVQSAVGSTDGHLTLYMDLRWSGTTSAIAANTSGTHRAVEVPVTRLDTFLAGLQPTDTLLVKLDVEGQEWDVLQGLMPALPGLARVAMMVEVHRLTPEAFDAATAAFDVLVMDGAGRLHGQPALRQAEFAGLDVVLVPKGTSLAMR